VPAASWKSRRILSPWATNRVPDRTAIAVDEVVASAAWKTSTLVLLLEHVIVFDPRTPCIPVKVSVPTEAPPVAVPDACPGIGFDDRLRPLPPSNMHE
jgi:hypothetical protein